MVCPLPGSDNQVYDFDEEKTMRFKMSCRNQFQINSRARKSTGTAKDVDECGARCGKDKGCYAFEYYQPTFPGGRADGLRNCDLITESIPDGSWVSLAMVLPLLCRSDRTRSPSRSRISISQACEFRYVSFCKAFCGPS